jgi:hypothetical protein
MESHGSIYLPVGLKSLQDVTEIPDDRVALDFGGELLEFALRLFDANCGSLGTAVRKCDCFDNPNAVLKALEVVARPTNRAESELKRARVWIERAIPQVAARLEKGQRECVMGIPTLDIDVRFISRRSQ